MEWPVTSGDYMIGDPSSPVAVVTLTSDYRAWDLKNYAICGTCFTENFGIEKVIVNVLSNPKISFLIVCGRESEHFAGQSLLALAENGVSTFGGSRKIVGSEAVIPYLNEIPSTAISRFLREIKVIDLVGTTDPGTIQKAIDSCSGNERGETPELSMPEIDDNSWKKYEKLVTQNVMSRIKKG
ncbi:tetrahydromethanopterin S-methyltransferase subunit A [Methanosarcina sp. KYL-1]|nr:tetrahydromethanopterin S-methyltransferase subunit A [Methanosarcina sp. KYL-1]MCQ1536390.1 tetrahydromethanopterin S-methyltransferase subunit A [Methanosarcina sp. KYL-1]